jgi:hypothetical protein
MKTKTTTPKPTLTDPLLTALLTFLDNAFEDDDEGSRAAEYASALADAEAMLGSRPLTTAFAQFLNRPAFNDQIEQAVLCARGNYDGTKGLLRRVMANTPEDEPIQTEAGEVRSLFWVTAETAMFRGACLMYAMLRGGGR